MPPRPPPTDGANAEREERPSHRRRRAGAEPRCGSVREQPAIGAAVGLPEKTLARRTPNHILSIKAIGRGQRQVPGFRKGHARQVRHTAQPGLAQRQSIVDGAELLGLLHQDMQERRC